MTTVAVFLRDEFLVLGNGRLLAVGLLIVEEEMAE